MYKKGVSKCNFVILSVAKDLVGTVTESIARCFTFVQHDTKPWVRGHCICN